MTLAFDFSIRDFIGEINKQMSSEFTTLLCLACTTKVALSSEDCAVRRKVFINRAIFSFQAALPPVDIVTS